MAAETRKTTDHEEIRKWVEERGGWPSTVKGTERGEESTGILRISFPGYSEANLERITWEDFFEKFDESGLVFLYQDKTATGEQSRFNKFVSRETISR